ncbi:MAG: hypothetical protein V2A56_00055 [bacterium]
MIRRGKKRNLRLLTMAFGVFFAANLSVYAEGTAATSCGRINLAHLDHLQSVVMLNGEEVRVVQIYSEAPDYHLISDSDEGFTCVDDVARAARLYLLLYNQEKNPVYLEKARGMLKFVMAMQATDGEFYNFLLPGPVINMSHQNSVKAIDWWSARAFRALAEGYEVFMAADPEFAGKLRAAVQRTLVRLRTYDPAKGNGEYELGYDAAAEFLSGFVAWYRVTNDKEMLPTLNRFADWVMQGTRQPTAEFPFTVHKPWRNLWHAWGQTQVEALANAGALLGNPEWIASARAEAEGWQRWLLVRGGLNYLEFNDSSYEKEKQFPQIAYDFNSMVQANAALFQATGDTAFAWTAVLAGSWFCGNNPAGVEIYDSATGRGYDGIVGPGEINRNSGAESTVEALMAMAQLYDLPVNRKALSVRQSDQEGMDSAVFSGNGWTITLRRNGSKYGLEVLHSRE